MTYDQIDRLVRGANPVTNLAALEHSAATVLPFDQLDQPRRKEMQTQERVEVKARRTGPPKGLVVGIATVAALAAGAVALFQSGDESPVADDQPVVSEAPTVATPIETATGFLDAYAAFDVDRMVSYLAPDVVLIGGFGGGSVEAFPLEIGWWEASGFQLLLGTCAESNVTGAKTTVRCTYDYHSIRSDRLGLGPYGGSWFDIGVEGGKVVSVNNALEFSSNGFSAEVWEPFADWVSATYPEDAALMYTDSTLSMYRADERSNSLWEQHSVEYVAVVTAQSQG